MDFVLGVDYWKRRAYEAEAEARRLEVHLRVTREMLKHYAPYHGETSEDECDE